MTNTYINVKNEYRQQSCCENFKSKTAKTTIAIPIERLKFSEELFIDWINVISEVTNVDIKVVKKLGRLPLTIRGVSGLINNGTVVTKLQPMKKTKVVFNPKKHYYRFWHLDDGSEEIRVCTLASNNVLHRLKFSDLWYVNGDKKIKLTTYINSQIPTNYYEITYDFKKDQGARQLFAHTLMRYSFEKAMGYNAWNQVINSMTLMKTHGLTPYQTIVHLLMFTTGVSTDYWYGTRGYYLTVSKDDITSSTASNILNESNSLLKYDERVTGLNNCTLKKQIEIIKKCYNHDRPISNIKTKVKNILK